MPSCHANLYDFQNAKDGNVNNIGALTTLGPTDFHCVDTFFKITVYHKQVLNNMRLNKR